jgi:hypothetical protein
MHGAMNQHAQHLKYDLLSSNTGAVVSKQFLQ